MIERLAIFRPSGSLLRIDGAVAEAWDAFFSKLPLPGHVNDHALAARTRPGESAYSAQMGPIPGDESEEDFIRAVEELS